ncbi:dihydropyrimidinase [Azospirillum picis]|uniref:Dihydropyrimidinase n=1 Tax=Azospirillum picis TaxID=488438 RepID=A0ABU0MDG3_9PROT|nr:dihydropyrimidinase [Azospirillum picis]MBP2297502.1 dihydropyrimidinase [Azospirillum picis]MDQ0531475.1 dihydropyrimidinase [Azospirillum picis]
MPQFDTVIRNGTLATASDVFAADLGITGGRIAAIGAGLGSGEREIDATGRLVLPGGVDAHCHLDQPSGDGSLCADDFESGTRAAAFGGTTTVIPFAAQFRGQPLRDAVADYHRRADGKALIDYAFHLIISDPTPQLTGQDLPALIRDGYTSFKIYMTYDDMKLNDRQVLELLDVGRREGAMAMIHAENADFIGWLTDRLLAAGHTQPRYHAESRPMLVEREATHRAIAMAELADVPILIVHVSGREAIEQIHWAQGRGMRIYGETCPQYMVLTEHDLHAHGFEGAKCICSPPPRDEANQAAVWDALAGGIFHIVSSDHAPFRYQDPRGKMLHGPDTPFNWVPNGVPGIETRLPILFSEGVKKGRIGLQRFVELTSTNPAKMYGLHPRKGSLAIGADADIVIYDPDRRVTITNGMLHHNVDYTPYEGLEVTGWPETVLSRGDLVIDRGTCVAAAGRGSFLRCDPPELAKPRPAIA